MSKMSASLIAEFIKLIFKNVKPGWKRILLSPEIKPALYYCFKSLDQYLINKGVTRDLIRKKGLGYYIRPIPEKILAAFAHFEPDDLKVIIIGQDPYLKVSDADGLCFSVPLAADIPPSLKNIYKCLERTMNIKIATHGNLTEWAKQGVLLLNRYLTRSPNICDSVVDGNGDSSPE